MQRLLLFIACPLVLPAQHPDFSGVWRAQGESSVTFLSFGVSEKEILLKRFGKSGKREDRVELLFNLASERSTVILGVPTTLTANGIATR